ncbi:MAG: WGR domain-containing protein [Chloroflexi bacterium]|nr:WGR domain-containing protein [Chloroflexota bacterium]MBL7164832.1 WGR domain-containing protein [Anaerolineales bacterium]
MILIRIDLAINMNRWYVVNVQATLFCKYAVVCGWGRRGTDYARWKIIPAESLDQAEEIARQIVTLKIKRGYESIGLLPAIMSRRSGS